MFLRYFFDTVDRLISKKAINILKDKQSSKELLDAIDRDRKGLSQKGNIQVKKATEK